MNTPSIQPDSHDDLSRVVDALYQVNLTLESLRVTISNLVNEADDHEKRIRSLERWSGRLSPVLSALIFLLGVISTTVVSRIF